MLLLSRFQSASVALLVFAGLAHSAAWAEGTAFTYQGRLDANTTPLTGVYDFRFRLASDSQGNTYVGSALLTNAVPVSNGLFLATLDFGTGVFTGSPLWLEISVKTNGVRFYSVLSPLQPLSPAPYSMFATAAGTLNGALPAAQLSGTLAVTQLPGSVVTNGASGLVLKGNFSGDGSGISNVSALTLGGYPSTAFWKTNGNAAIDPAKGGFLGTTDYLPLEIKVNGVRALRLEPTASGLPNVIAGGPANSVGNSSYAVTIAGGSGNIATNSYAAVGGGYNNVAGGVGSSVGGGYYDYALGSYATVSGGVFSYATGDRSVAAGSYNNATGFAATVCGGNYSTASGYGSTVAGGENNAAGGGPTYDTGHATVGGGRGNSATNSFSTVAGGVYNFADGIAGFIGGGTNNVASGPYSVVAGGVGHDATNSYAAVGGGYNNVAGGVGSSVGGGYYDYALGSYATVSGGVFSYATGDRSVAAGSYNNATGFASTVGGGNYSTSSGYGSTVAGGENNSASGGVTYATGHATVGGGNGNSATNAFATVPGGYLNVAGGISSLAAGQRAKALHNGAFVWGDTSATTDVVSTTANSVTLRAAGGYRLFSDSGMLAGAYLAPGSGSWTSLSDRNAKENLFAVDAAAVLDKVAALPLSIWNYKTQSDTVRHIGPMAQDFKAAFGVGETEKGISTVDADGVALAAIQGLNLKVEQMRADAKAKDAEIESLKHSLTDLKSLVNNLLDQGRSGRAAAEPGTRKPEAM
jgi:hypothetical protein